jgi:hypothetical protein
MSFPNSKSGWMLLYQLPCLGQCVFHCFRPVVSHACFVLCHFIQLHTDVVLESTVSKTDVGTTKDSAQELFFCDADHTILVDNWFECVADVCCCCHLFCFLLVGGWHFCHPVDSRIFGRCCNLHHPRSQRFLLQSVLLLIRCQRLLQCPFCCR